MICSADNLVKNYGADPVLDHVSLVINEKENDQYFIVCGAGDYYSGRLRRRFRRHDGGK